MKRKKTAISIASVLALCAAIAAWFIYTDYYRPNIKDSGASLYVFDGDTPDMICDRADSIGLLIRSGSFRRIASERLPDTIHIAGHYRFKPEADNRFIVNSIIQGWQTPTKLVIAGNIRTFEKLSSVIASQIYADSASVIAAFNNDSIMEMYGFNRYSYIGMVIPNTYEIYWTISPENLLSRLKKEYDRFWNETRTEKAEKTGMSKEEIMTLASIVYEESKAAHELPTIAGVYMNRIRKGIPLQADPTVKFAVGDFGLKRILYRHLRIDSPYNTYRRRGLPPGPIAIPSIKAIDAVLDYEKHDYLYFCASPELNGTHTFAKNLKEHGRNAQRYRKAIEAIGL